MWLFRASEGMLAQKLLTLASTILLLQRMKILPTQGICKTCHDVIKDKYKKNSLNYIFWQCRNCKGSPGKTALRANTILDNSNIKLERFVMLLWAFSDRGRTFEQIINGACLPSDPGYKENSMSTKTVAKYNKYFRFLCEQDYKTNMKKKLGGPGKICEIDESMFGKLKFGKGDKSKRRGQWVFGGIMRNDGDEEGLAFAQICENNKRTKKVLWPIIQENLEVGTIIYSDGWRAYRKLPTIGFPHRWLDHSHKTSPYVHPADKEAPLATRLHTNKIEGFWGCLKRWLPSSGPYNLSQNINVYLWFRTNKLNKVDPFWALVNLVKENNSIDVMNRAHTILPDVVGCDEEEEDAMEYESDADNSDSDSSNSDYPCPFCHYDFTNQEEVIDHMEICSETDQEMMKPICPYCQQTFETTDEMEQHIGIH